MTTKEHYPQISDLLDTDQLYNPVSIVRLAQENIPHLEPLAIHRLRLELTRLVRQHQFPARDGELMIGTIPVPAWLGKRWIGALRGNTPETLEEILARVSKQVIKERLVVYDKKKDCAASLGISLFQLDGLMGKYNIREPQIPKSLMNRDQAIAILKGLQKSANLTVEINDLACDNLNLSTLRNLILKLKKAGFLTEPVTYVNRKRQWPVKGWRDGAVHYFLLRCRTDVATFWNPKRFGELAPDSAALVESAVKGWLNDYANHLRTKQGWKGRDLLDLLVQQARSGVQAPGEKVKRP